jgi:hypothetical protein
MKNPFKSISKLFTKGGNAIGNTAKSMFSKSNMNTFRNTLQDTLNQQGDVLKRSAVVLLRRKPLTLGATAILAPNYYHSSQV